MSTKIIPKKSTQSSAVPSSQHLALGEIAINHADGIIYTRHPSTGTVYALNSGGSTPAATRFWSFAISGNYLYLGSLLTSDFPSSGSIYDVPLWDINRTLTNATGDIVSESSAIGAWSNKTNLTYA